MSCRSVNFHTPQHHFPSRGHANRTAQPALVLQAERGPGGRIVRNGLGRSPEEEEDSVLVEFVFLVLAAHGLAVFLSQRCARKGKAGHESGGQGQPRRPDRCERRTAASEYSTDHAPTSIQSELRLR